MTAADDAATPAATGPRAGDLGVVVVSYNTRDLLEACLGRLTEAIEASGVTAEIWVVDNASSDASPDMVAEAFPAVHLLAETRNLGFTAANNRLLGPWASAGQACPDRVLLLNPDAEIDATALQELMRALDRDAEAAVVGPALRYPNGRFQHAAFRFPGLIQTMLDLFPVPRLLDRPVNGRYPRQRYATGQAFDVDFVLGACMLIRGEALRAIGPLDEGFFMYCEEIDWCKRAAEAGWRRLCVPAASVLHHGGGASGQAAFRATAFVNLWRSRRRYFALHAPAWRQIGFALLLRLGLARRVVGDWASARRGRIEFAEFAARMVAYRGVLAPLDPALADRRGAAPRQACP